MPSHRRRYQPEPHQQKVGDIREGDHVTLAKGEIREIDGILYCNDGDWVEGCTALVEHADGRMEIIHWPEEIAKREERERQAGEDGDGDGADEGDALFGVGHRDHADCFPNTVPISDI